MANSNGWGDGASNNSIGWGQGANNAISWGDSHLTSWAGLTDISGFDSSAISFFNAAGITSITQQDAIDNLVRGLKDDGIWTKMKAIYPFVGGTAATHKFNLKDPRDLDAAYRLVFNGGWTHSSTGATPNGVNGYADTKLPNNTMSQNSMTMCTYLRTNTTPTPAVGDLAVWNAFFGSCIYANQAGNFRATNNGTNFQLIASADSLGFFLNKRINSTQITLQKNSTLTTFSSASQNHLSSNFIISRTGDFAGEYSNRQTAFVAIGDGLTNTESANFYTRVQAFQTALSRQV
jgi:hypothetical protein